MKSIMLNSIGIAQQIAFSISILLTHMLNAPIILFLLFPVNLLIGFIFYRNIDNISPFYSHNSLYIIFMSTITIVYTLTNNYTLVNLYWATPSLYLCYILTLYRFFILEKTIKIKLFYALMAMSCVLQIMVPDTQSTLMLIIFFMVISTTTALYLNLKKSKLLVSTFFFVLHFLRL